MFVLCRNVWVCVCFIVASMRQRGRQDPKSAELLCLSPPLNSANQHIFLFVTDVLWETDPLSHLTVCVCVCIRLPQYCLQCVRHRPHTDLFTGGLNSLCVFFQYLCSKNTHPIALFQNLVNSYIQLAATRKWKLVNVWYEMLSKSRNSENLTVVDFSRACH